MITYGSRGFWRSDRVLPDWPPFDPEGMVFLGRFVDEWGVARFGEAWRPDDPFDGSIRSDGTLQDIELTGAMANGAFADAMRASHASRARLQGQWASIIGDLAKAGAEARLRFALSYGPGGLEAGRPADWHRTDWLVIFARCEMPPNRPWNGSNPRPVFLVREDADRLKRGWASGERPQWWPLDGETMKAWVARPEVRAEAERRASDALVGPQQSDHIRAALRMWSLASRTGTEGSMQQAWLQAWRRSE